jgi:hypothetical protein
VRFEASRAGRITAGADHVAPPLVDLLETAATWQPVLVRATQRLPSLFFTCVDQATYRSPFGATSPAGKLFTRKAALAGVTISWTSAILVGALQVAPPSVDFTIHWLSSVERRVAPSKIT